MADFCDRAMVGEARGEIGDAERWLRRPSRLEAQSARGNETRSSDRHVTSYRQSVAETPPSSSGDDGGDLLHRQRQGRATSPGCWRWPGERTGGSAVLLTAPNSSGVPGDGGAGRVLPSLPPLGLTKDSDAVAHDAHAGAVEVTGSAAVVVVVSPPKAFDELRRRTCRTHMVTEGAVAAGHGQGGALAAAFDRVVEPGGWVADRRGDLRQRPASIRSVLSSSWMRMSRPAETGAPGFQETTDEFCC